MREFWRPRTLNDILGSLASHNNLVTKATGLCHHLKVERVGQIPSVNDRNSLGVRIPERHGAPRPGAEQLGNHAERVLVVDGEVVILLRSAVALRGEELDAGLLGRKAHGVATWLTGRILPELRVGHAVVDTGVGESSKGECGKEALLLILPELHAALKSVAVVDKVVRGKAFLFGLIENEHDLLGRRG